jgi:hypothetical protein
VKYEREDVILTDIYRGQFFSRGRGRGGEESGIEEVRDLVGRRGGLAGTAWCHIRRRWLLYRVERLR